MDPVSLLKALLIHAAYEGACAVCEPLISNPDCKPVAIDPLIQDVPLQQKGLLVYEEAKVQYAATGKYTDGSSQNLTSSVTWTSSTTSVATITSVGLATALKQGNTTISATSGSIVGSTSLKVTK